MANAVIASVYIDCILLLADRTAACSMNGSWHDIVVCLSD